VVDVGPIPPWPVSADGVDCDRCGSPADAERFDVSTFDQPGLWIWGRITCTKPGCVDEDGSTAVLPPDEPGRITREDRRWIRHHERLAEQLGRANRALMEAM
jgi:hypothetical protein